VKLPATDPASRAAGQLGYRCETTFYREVANRLQLDIPRCYFAAMNECGDGFTLVLEDLAPAQSGDQIAGCSVDQARAAAVNVAGLHAPTWNDPSLREFDWLIPDLAAYPDVAAAILVDATKQFLDRYAVSRSTAATLHNFADRFVDWAAGRPEPFAMLHSDYRLDNLLFAQSDAPRPVVAVDWQVVTVGSPLRDVAFLVATGLSTASRRAGEKGIVEAYHRRLVALGVDGYGADSAGRTTDTACSKARSSPCWARPLPSPPHGAIGCSPSWPRDRRRRSPTWTRCRCCDGIQDWERVRSASERKMLVIASG
jgi:hypothetical protein